MPKPYLWCFGLPAGRPYGIYKRDVKIEEKKNQYMPAQNKATQKYIDAIIRGLGMAQFLILAADEKIEGEGVKNEQ